MNNLLSRAAVFSVFLAIPILVSAGPQSAKDCAYVLESKDYYSYAENNHLELDYLRSIDYETWQSMRSENNSNLFGLFSGGLFSLSDDYSTFNEKRTKYFRNVHYNRTESEAKNILQIATAPRAYDAYAQCL